MSAHEGPTGQIVVDGLDDDGESRLVRWLGPQRPRRAGAGLLLTSAVATFVSTQALLGTSFATLPTGVAAVLRFAPLVSGAVLTVGLAVFVLGGSLASRYLGSLAALAGLLPLLVLLVLTDSSPNDWGWLGAAYLVAVALHFVTLVALIWPLNDPVHPSQKGEDTDDFRSR